jgi:hypothetical protein
MFDHAFGKINETLKEICDSVEGMSSNLTDSELTYDSRRERIATACLTALLADTKRGVLASCADSVAQEAVIFAEALLAALDEPAPRKKKK